MNNIVRFSVQSAISISLILLLGFNLSCNKISEVFKSSDSGLKPNPAANETTLITTAAVTATNPGPGGFDFTIDQSGLSKSTVILKTSKGTLKIKLYSKDAPVSTHRFVELINAKFYDGLSFHRVEDKFVVQTGDPGSKTKQASNVGAGGSGQKLTPEFNGRKHVKGTVALGRTRDLNSADSQFYITLGDFPHLDQQYTVIGQVVDYGEKSGDKDVLERIVLWDDVVEMKIEP